VWGSGDPREDRGGCGAVRNSLPPWPQDLQSRWLGAHSQRARGRAAGEDPCCARGHSRADEECARHGGEHRPSVLLARQLSRDLPRAGVVPHDGLYQLLLPEAAHPRSTREDRRSSRHRLQAPRLRLPRVLQHGGLGAGGVGAPRQLPGHRHRVGADARPQVLQQCSQRIQLRRVLHPGVRALHHHLLGPRERGRCLPQHAQELPRGAGGLRLRLVRHLQRLRSCGALPSRTRC